MADKESAERACATPNPLIDGRKANVNLAYLGAKPKTHSQPGRRTSRGELVALPCSALCAGVRIALYPSKKW